MYDATTGSANTDLAAGVQVTTAIARRAAIAGGVGTLIEYYSFGVYGLLTVYLAPLFFPGDDPAAGVIAVLAVYGSGFIMRPLGGIFFGRIGDRRGRKAALVMTIVGMGACCSLLGLLPVHAQVGSLAPLLLLLVRLAEGFAAGGEIGGSSIYIAESTPRGRRGFFGAFTPVGSTGGFAVGAAVVGGVTLLVGDSNMAEWGWRIPPLVAVPLTIFCLFYRLRIDDSPEFKVIAARKKLTRSPLTNVFAHATPNLLKLVGISIATNGTGYVGTTYMGIYLINNLGYDKRAVFWLAALVIGVACALMPVAGRLSDRFGPFRVFATGCVGYVVLAYPIMISMAGTSTLVVVGLVYFLYMLLNVLVQVPVFPVFAELFPPAYRYTGVALGFNIGAIAAGGLAPLAAAELVATTGDPTSPAIWVIGVSVIGLVAGVASREAMRQVALR